MKKKSSRKCPKKTRITDHFTRERRIDGEVVARVTKVFVNGKSTGRTYIKGDPDAFLIECLPQFQIE
ncbi:MAG: hypothetical protein K2P81_10305 [Bacteriovoracaceae bacterium]|nr:hypothetical protein [Bacteriovoracaceae bacterium]